MTGVQWQHRDEGSGGPGHLQAVVPDGAYARYHAFTDHTMGCDDCEFGEAHCETAKQLWAAYVRRRDAAA
ncbi:hypothetical protein PV518_45560 [Streptomyces sp. ND04-05B]|uniref:hypothetical protein n=1 Tax=Streptomyces sp. ND04-05B TaxID=3028693 RepID=UPI0029A812CF|nr:hypothetical protein [Streptomyces sp. ND04-05B]MDX3069326.1 hypothetical protein [Streptomyces sp. ND04-05B]